MRRLRSNKGKGKSFVQEEGVMMRESIQSSESQSEKRKGFKVILEGIFDTRLTIGISNSWS